ncbi:hypothetical protein [Pelomonas sp. Root1444]|uniref:hypothetical protein n=1 Tax=Pelomonas sp. Root1444 TaxID=1736464 RepID=UPI0007038DFB|nr:hypothetical protein [Pelomonas sp. Root1444]KQY80214.1 hypothetical protein ASD35_09725 [Pelomonas sp. Root1444]
MRARCPSATRAAAQIPTAVCAAWAQLAPDEFPGLAVDDDAWLRCTIGLAQFFEACRLQREQGPCALPSKAADSVWHVWLRTDPAGLDAWQQRHFGQAVQHREAEALGAPLDGCLARTWAGACRSEGGSPVARRLPLLFALDGLMCVPTGWAYGHEGGAIVHRPIDGAGRASGDAVPHAALGVSSLAALGLLSAAEVAAMRRPDDGGSGGWAGTSSSDGGAASCDGGSPGCSCGGSGCGGGS